MPRGLTSRLANPAAGPVDHRGDRARAEELVSLVFALADRMRAHFEGSIAVFDLSPPQAKALRYLATAGGAPMRDLAVMLRCDASYVTGIVDRLESRGLVERQALQADRRVKALVLTAQGYELSAKLWDRVLEKAPPVAGLVDGEQRLLLELLRRLHDGSDDVAFPDSRPMWCESGCATAPE